MAGSFRPGRDSQARKKALRRRERKAPGPQPHGIPMPLGATTRARSSWAKPAMSASDASLPVAAPAPRSRAAAFLALAVASTGVVYGDIGTSPLYAFKESISHLRGPAGAVAGADVIGVISLMFWSLMA